MRVRILYETYNRILENTLRKSKLLKEFYYLVEQQIEVGDGLEKKLKFANTKLSNEILQFLKSDNIKDNTPVEKLDFEANDEKTLTVYSKSQQGTKKSKQKLLKILDYIGMNVADIKAYEVEELIGFLKKGDTTNMKVVKGADILWAYHCKNFDGETGSCMRHEAAQNYLEIYTDNPDKVQCLVLTNPENGKIRGRALLWTLDSGGKYMDRVYVVNKEFDKEFNSYAESNGMSKYPLNGEATVTLNNNKKDYNQYPYMDTFKYYSPSSSQLNTKFGEYTITSTNGKKTKVSGQWSTYLQHYIPIDNAVYVPVLESYMHREDLYWSQRYNEFLYNDDKIATLTIAHEVIYKKDAITKNGITIHKDDIQQIEDAAKTFDGTPYVETYQFLKKHNIINYEKLDVYTQIVVGHMKELFLGGQQIENTIPNLYGFHQLELLNLNNNRIVNIPDLNMPKLLSLVLNNNSIEVLPNFQKLPNLKRINLNNNKLETIPVLLNSKFLKIIQAINNNILDNERFIIEHNYQLYHPNVSIQMYTDEYTRY